MPFLPKKISTDRMDLTIKVFNMNIWSHVTYHHMIKHKFNFLWRRNMKSHKNGHLIKVFSYSGLEWKNNKIIAWGRGNPFLVLGTTQTQKVRFQCLKMLNFSLNFSTSELITWLLWPFPSKNYWWFFFRNLRSLDLT